MSGLPGPQRTIESLLIETSDHRACDGIERAGPAGEGGEIPDHGRADVGSIRRNRDRREAAEDVLFFKHGRIQVPRPIRIE